MRGQLVERRENRTEGREAVLRDAHRRLDYMRWAISLSIGSGIVTERFVVLIFVDTLFSLQNGRLIVLAFIGA